MYKINYLDSRGEIVSVETYATEREAYAQMRAAVSAGLALWAATSEPMKGELDRICYNVGKYDEAVLTIDADARAEMWAIAEIFDTQQYEPAYISECILRECQRLSEDGLETSDWLVVLERAQSLWEQFENGEMTDEICEILRLASELVEEY